MTLKKLKIEVVNGKRKKRKKYPYDFKVVLKKKSPKIFYNFNKKKLLDNSIEIKIKMGVIKYFMTSMKKK